MTADRPTPWRSERQRSADTDTAHNPSGIAGGDGGGAG
jgi:hypothetical protein